MKKVSVLLLLCFLCGISYSQKMSKLYKLYNSQEYVKCVEQCNAALQKKPEMLEAYYVKAIAYFEMAHSSSTYKDFVKNPLLECLTSLSILSSKDEDREVLEEHGDTLQLIKEYAEARAKKIKTSNTSEAQAINQKLSSIFHTQKADGLEYARLDAEAGRYDKCYSKIDKLYAKSPAEISSSHENYSALTQGAILLAENWMFSDLFSVIRNYKQKYSGNYAISEGFKKALYISIDTARTDENKGLFYDFSLKGLELYPEDKGVASYIENRWIELINSQAVAYRSTANHERTWKDSVLLRNAYRYLSMAKEVFPNNRKLEDMETRLNSEFHTIPLSFEKENFKRYALEAVNAWRTKGCDCDTSQVVYVAPVPTIEWDTTLERLANEHAREMFFENHSEDVNIHGETPWDRINKTRYKGTTYENENGSNFVQAMKMAFCVGYGISFSGISSDEEMKHVVDSMVTHWIMEKNSQNCMKVMTPDVTHMAIGMYGDRWVFWAITKYDILIQKKKK
ncbi:MAG: CAP domain-containing protein [Bacteroidales bacterium]|nr:CAP domain-containing protein [Bacteroidales bacterium]